MNAPAFGGVPGRVYQSRAVRWGIIIGAAAMVAMGLVLLFLLTQATNNRELYERNYARLFVLNVVVAGLLVGVILWMVIRLALRLRRGKFGSRLLVKLAAIFALVGFVPGLLIYVVSYQFVSRSIESWFDVKVEGALVAGLSLGRTTLDTLSNELSSKTRTAATQLSGNTDSGAALSLERLAEQLGASDIVLWSSSGKMIASAGKSRYDINPERPSVQQLRLARNQGVVAQAEGVEECAPGGASDGAIAIVAAMEQ